MATTTISMDKCRKKLSLLWFIGGGILLITLLFYTLINRFGDDIEQIWGWFLPTVMPTLSLIIGVWVGETLSRKSTVRNVDRFFFRLVYCLSLFYLAMVLLHLTIDPFIEIPPLDLIKKSNLWLGPMQGLVSGALGAFFFHKEKDEENATERVRIYETDI